MNLPPVVSPEEWSAAREELLVKEKELTRARDALAAERRRMPRQAVSKDYRFEGPDGEVGLADVFEGRHQLIVCHFMFDPEWEDGCASCTAAMPTPPAAAETTTVSPGCGSTVSTPAHAVDPTPAMHAASSQLSSAGLTASESRSTTTNSAWAARGARIAGSPR